ncbi:MAG: OmpA family protein [Flavobacterium sp.]
MKQFCIFLFVLGFIANISAQEQFSVYFDSNKYELNKSQIKRLNNWLEINKDSKVVGAYGFCDEDGSTLYNDTLSQRRVDFVYNLIKNKIKIREDFKSISFGELHSQSKVKAENRKVTLYYILPKDFSHEAEIVKVKEPVAENPIETPKVEIPKKEVKYPEKMVFENPDGTETTLVLDTIFMKRLASAAKGDKLKVKNLNFVINTFAIVAESRPKLYELLYVLKNNPNLKIEIQGHLCCNPVDKVDLSTQRAKAICNFLTSQGIERSRLSYKGFGSTMPIYPLPEKSEKERAENRRVEILIIDN